jgi:hypothetical protein
LKILKKSYRAKPSIRAFGLTVLVEFFGSAKCPESRAAIAHPQKAAPVGFDLEK